MNFFLLFCRRRGKPFQVRQGFSGSAFWHRQAIFVISLIFLACQSDPPQTIYQGMSSFPLLLQEESFGLFPLSLGI